MSESKHTPGPWRVLGNGVTYGVAGPSGEYICEGTVVSVSGVNQAPGDANSRLIAAAPELLAEYKRAIGHLRSFADAAPMDATAETAAILYCADRLIAKAEGRS